jgi:hypothetical protein
MYYYFDCVQFVQVVHTFNNLNKMSTIVMNYYNT